MGSGTTLGLIRGLAKPADPETVAAAVEDILEDNPEWTTTVQDGAISYAKLNSSLKESVDDVGSLKSATSVLEPAATSGDVGKFLKVKTVSGGKATAYEFGSGGGGGGSDIDDTAGAGDTDKTWSADKLTKEFDSVKLSKNNLSAWLFAEGKYLDSNYELADYEGYNTYKIPCEHLDFIFLSCESNMFGNINGNYKYALETENGFSRSLTSANIVIESNGKNVIFVAPANTKAIYFTLKADVVSSINTVKNTARENAVDNDNARSFTIPINNSTAASAPYYLRKISNVNYIYSWSNASYRTWWMKVKAGDTLKFKNSMSGISYNACFIDTSDAIATISATTYTFATDAVVCVFENVADTNNSMIIQPGAKLHVDFDNVYNSPVERQYNGMTGVAFGTSLTYRAITANGYLDYLPDMSGATFDNQGVGSGAIYWDAGSQRNILEIIKAYNSYSGKQICLLEGFVNDWYNNRPLGTWKDTTETSVCGCVRSALNFIMSQNASITIFLILDPYGKSGSGVDFSSTATNSANLTQYEFYEEIAKVAESLGVPVIKEYSESQICENTPQYLDDYIHPTALGAKQSAQCIYDGMMKHHPLKISS